MFPPKAVTSLEVQSRASPCPTCRHGPVFPVLLGVRLSQLPAGTADSPEVQGCVLCSAQIRQILVSGQCAPNGLSFLFMFNLHFNLLRLSSISQDCAPSLPRRHAPYSQPHRTGQGSQQGPGRDGAGPYQQRSTGAGPRPHQGGGIVGGGASHYYQSGSDGYGDGDRERMGSRDGGPRGRGSGGGGGGRSRSRSATGAGQHDAGSDGAGTVAVRGGRAR